MIIAVALILPLVLFVDVQSRKLPDYIPSCKKSDPNFNKCVIEAVETVRPYLANGIPKIRVPPLEPLHIPQLAVNRDLDNIKVKALLKNIVIHGANGFKINTLKANTDKLTLDLTINIPSVNVTLDYDIDGRLLVIPLRGKGSFIGNFTNIGADVRATGDIQATKKGTKFVNIKTIKIKAKVGDQLVKFINTDRNPQNELITNTAANFVNQNRRQVLEIVLPIVEETTEAVIKQMGNSVFKTIPLHELLPQ